MCFILLLLSVNVQFDRIAGIFNLVIEEVKQRIATALKDAHNHPVFGDRFRKYRVKGFAKVDNEFFDLTRRAMEVLKE